MTTSPEIEALVAEPAPITLLSGKEIRVERLRTRGLMSLLKILTRGAADILPSLQFDPAGDAAEFSGQLLGAMVFAIPDAEQETIEFVNRMVSLPPLPAGASKATELKHLEDEVALRAELQDPELDDLITVVSEIIKIEAPHILALGKRLGTLLESQQLSTRAKQGSSSETGSEG